ncbi:hypothetical protein G7046_g1683 [Stylonectria norvegica]|nr:hypothetical protein G7046_g1683 [Stylonectria norvegica]
MPTRKNLGPLTKAFTYPSSCNVAVLGCTTCDGGWQAQSCGGNTLNAQGVQDNPDCWPPRANTGISTGVALGGWGFYSPGLECPVGYATSCVATGSVDGGFDFQFSVLKSETGIGCCPTGYACKHNPGVDAAQTCYRVVSTGSFPTVQCESGTSNQYSYVQVPSTFTVTASGDETTSVISAITVFAPLIQLNRRAVDLPSSTEASTTSGSQRTTGTATATSTSTSTSATSQATSGSSSSGGLSVGAQAGIGVGAGLVGLALIAAAVLFWRRRRKTYTASPTEEPKYEVPGQETHPVELPGTQRYAPSELP